MLSEVWLWNMFIVLSWGRCLLWEILTHWIHVLQTHTHLKANISVSPSQKTQVELWRDDTAAGVKKESQIGKTARMKGLAGDRILPNDPVFGCSEYTRQRFLEKWMIQRENKKSSNYRSIRQWDLLQCLSMRSSSCLFYKSSGSESVFPFKFCKLWARRWQPPVEWPWVDQISAAPWAEGRALIPCHHGGFFLSLACVQVLQYNNFPPFTLPTDTSGNQRTSPPIGT